MADVQHIYHSDADAGVSAAMMVVLLVVLVALAAAIYFSLYGLPKRATPSNDLNIGIEGQMDLPKSQPSPTSY